MNYSSLLPNTFVIGSPIEHSLSPIIHNYWLSFYGIKGQYEALEIRPEFLENFVNTMRSGAFIGGNVTIPHKEKITVFIDRKDPIVDKIGAANCLWFEGETLCATNTDAYGFITYLEKTFEEISYENILVLGAGGAARAALYALLKKNVHVIYLANRTVKRAQDLAQYFSPKIVPMDLKETNKILSKIDLIINTTAFGLNNICLDEEIIKESFPLDFGYAKKTAIAYDLVYKPLKTPFLYLAEQQHLRILDGLGMLIYQAMPCFNLWYGQNPEIDMILKAKLVERANG